MPLNHQIRAKSVRVVDEEGSQFGVLTLQEALELAHQKGLDLVQVTEKVDPPVCRLTNYGKYLYSIEKKERKAKKKQAGETKSIRLGFNISSHDIQTRATQAIKFLKKGHKIKVELPLRGRQKALPDTAKKKVEEFVQELQKEIPVKVEKDLKREPRGFTMIISNP